jgi:TANFOR domain-containing protein
MQYIMITLFTKIRYALFVILFFAGSFSGWSQHYPVQLSTIITPPYSPRLSDYAESGFDRVQVIINPLDMTLNSYKVKIKLIIESFDGRVRIQTDPNYLPPPIYLNGGVTEIVTSYDIQDLFDANHLVFQKGITKNQYLINKKLPENYYRIGFVLLDYNRSTLGGTSNEVIVSNFGYSQAGIFLNDPPILNMPFNNTKLTLFDPQQIVLQWTPRHRGSPNAAFNTEYVIRLYEVWNDAYNAAAITQTQMPIYETTVSDNRYIYGISDPLLIPGKKYVWTIQARDADGRDMFRNNGLSEAYMFTWGDACKVPENISGAPLIGPGIELKWTTLTGHSDYDIQYRPSGSTGDWYEENSLLAGSRIYNLKYNASYEARIRANCGTYSSEFSAPVLVKIPEAPKQDFACGNAGTLPPIKSTTPITVLPSGALFYAGGFECHVVEAISVNGGFNGSCYVVVPFYGFAKVLHTFKGIKVNNDLQMFAGKLISVTDTVKGNALSARIDNAAKTAGSGYTNDQLQKLLGASRIVTVDGRIATITVNDQGQVVVTLKNGDEEIIEVEEGEKVIISDEDGEQYYVENGSVVKAGEALAAKAAAASSSQMVANIDSIRKLLPLVEFTPSPNMQYGFDKLRYPALRGQYTLNTVHDKEYILPYKAVASGAIDIVDAKMPATAGLDASGLLFRINQTPTLAMPSTQNDIRTVNVTSLIHGDEQVLEAVYSLTDTAGNKVEETLGQLNIVAYDEQIIKLIIVPISIDKTYSQPEINSLINKIYAQSVTKWVIQWTDPYENKAWDINGDEKFDDTDSDNRMDYTPEMKALIKAYNRDYNVEKQAVYVFLFPGAHVSSLKGYMPFNKQFAFVFTDRSGTSDIAHYIAHEIAHGTFNLRHTFSDANPWFQSEGTSDNLMDYTPTLASNLNKYQWDLIHNPASVLFAWLEDEKEAEIGSFLVSPTIEAIRNANIDKKTNLELDQKKNFAALTDDIKLGNNTITHVGLWAGYSLDPADLFKEFSETLKIDPSEYNRSSFSYENDNEKYVKYEFHQLEMTQLPAPYINTIKPGGRTVVQFVVKASESNKFEEYLFPMDDIFLENVNWVSQLDEGIFGLCSGCWKYTCCRRAAEYMMGNTNIANCSDANIAENPPNMTISGIINTASFTDNSSTYNFSAYNSATLNFNSENLNDAIKHMKDKLKIGRPILIGVHYNNGTTNPPNNANRATRHFMVIVGMGVEGENTYFRFYDPGRSLSNEGNATSPNNRLIVNYQQGSIQGDYNDGTYTITEIFKTN